MRAPVAAALLLTVSVGLSAQQPPARRPRRQPGLRRRRRRPDPLRARAPTPSRRRSSQPLSRSSAPSTSRSAWPPPEPRGAPIRRSPCRRCSRRSNRTPTGSSASARSCCSRASTIRGRRDVMRGALARQERPAARGRLHLLRTQPRSQAVVPRLLAAVADESSEFVRPALTRALAAYGDRSEGPRDDVGSGDEGAGVLPQRGDRGARRLSRRVRGGAAHRGREDRRTAAGWMPRSHSARSATSDRCPLLAGLQRTAPRESQPAIAAAICLLGVNCESHEPYLADTLRFGIDTIGFQELVRGSASGLAALAAAGREEAGQELIRQGASDPRPGARGDRPRCRDGRVAEHCCHAESTAGRRDAGPGRGAAARRFRHARRGFRGRALLRHRPPHILGVAGRLALADGRGNANPETGVLIPPDGSPRATAMGGRRGEAVNRVTARPGAPRRSGAGRRGPASDGDGGAGGAKPITGHLERALGARRRSGAGQRGPRERRRWGGRRGEADRSGHLERATARARRSGAGRRGPRERRRWGGRRGEADRSGIWSAPRRATPERRGATGAPRATAMGGPAGRSPQVRSARRATARDAGAARGKGVPASDGDGGGRRGEADRSGHLERAHGARRRSGAGQRGPRERRRWGGRRGEADRSGHLERAHGARRRSGAGQRGPRERRRWGVRRGEAPR